MNRYEETGVDQPTYEDTYTGALATPGGKAGVTAQVACGSVGGWVLV